MGKVPSIMQSNLRGEHRGGALAGRENSDRFPPSFLGCELRGASSHCIHSVAMKEALKNERFSSQRYSEE